MLDLNGSLQVNDQNGTALPGVAGSLTLGSAVADDGQVRRHVRHRGA